MWEDNMIIGINTLFLIPNRVGGTEYYTRSFLKYLELSDKNNSYVVFCNKENYATFNFVSDKWKKVLCPIRSSNRVVRILYEQFIFPIIVLGNKCNILHSFGYFGPVLGKYKKVVTVHDANWKDCPEDTSPFQIFVMNFLVSINIFFAEKILTDSDFSKSRLDHYFPNQRKKILVVPGAIEDDFVNQLKIKSTPIIKGKYLLNVSKFYPHKKIPYLISLFKQIEKEDKFLKLVLVGQDGDDEELIMKMIENDNRIIHYKKVKFPELVNLYKHSSALVFPSIYEGFGYPVYEAISASIPVFVSSDKLYSSEIRKEIFCLEFDINRDSNYVLTNISMKKKYYFSSSYEKSARQLIKIYE